jgi:hypothetical protein
MMLLRQNSEYADVSVPEQQQVRVEQDNLALATTLLQWMWVIAQRLFVHRDPAIPDKTEAAFNEAYAHLMPKGKVTPSQYIRVKNRRTNVVSRIDYRACDRSKIIIDAAGDRVWNKFPFPPSPPATNGNSEGLDLLLENLLCLCNGSEPDRLHLLRWIAALVFRPEHRVQHAVLMTGNGGTGKSTLKRLLEVLLGHKPAVQNISSDDLGGSFNGYFEGSRLVVVEEVKQSDNYNLYNKLKAPITEDTISINEKNMPRREVANHSHMLFFSNYKHTFPIDQHDRRFFVVWSDETTAEAEAKKADGYFNDINDFLQLDEEASGVWAFRRYLEEEILPEMSANFHLDTPPMTTAKQQLAASSLHPIEEWAADMLSAGTDELFKPKQFFQLKDMYRAISGVDALKATSKNRQKVKEALHSVGLREKRFSAEDCDGRQTYAWFDVDGWNEEMLHMIEHDKDKLATHYLPYAFQ